MLYHLNNNNHSHYFRHLYVGDSLLWVWGKNRTKNWNSDGKSIRVKGKIHIVCEGNNILKLRNQNTILRRVWKGLNRVWAMFPKRSGITFCIKLAREWTASKLIRRFSVSQNYSCDFNKYIIENGNQIILPHCFILSKELLSYSVLFLTSALLLFFSCKTYIMLYIFSIHLLKQSNFMIIIMFYTLFSSRSEAKAFSFFAIVSDKAGMPVYYL